MGPKATGFRKWAAVVTRSPASKPPPRGSLPSGARGRGRCTSHSLRRWEMWCPSPRPRSRRAHQPDPQVLPALEHPAAQARPARQRRPAAPEVPADPPDPGARRASRTRRTNRTRRPGRARGASRTRRPVAPAGPVAPAAPRVTLGPGGPAGPCGPAGPWAPPPAPPPPLTHLRHVELAALEIEIPARDREEVRPVFDRLREAHDDFRVARSSGPSSCRSRKKPSATSCRSSVRATSPSPSSTSTNAASDHELFPPIEIIETAVARLRALLLPLTGGHCRLCAPRGAHDHHR